MPLGTEIVLSPGHIVLDREPAPLKGSQQPLPQVSASVYCGQAAGWIKMPIGTEVGFNPGEIVLDGDPAAPKRATAAPPLFGPCLLWPNGRPSQQLLNSCTMSCKL